MSASNTTELLFRQSLSTYFVNKGIRKGRSIPHSIQEVVVTHVCCPKEGAIIFLESQQHSRSEQLLG
jgi:hypothetical protein